MRALRSSGSLSMRFLMLCSLTSSTRRTDASTWRGFASPICSRMSSTAFASPFIAFCTSFTTILSLTVRFASFTSSNDLTLSMGVTLPDLMGMVRAISRASARLFLSCLFRALALPPFLPFFRPVCPPFPDGFFSFFSVFAGALSDEAETVTPSAAALPPVPASSGVSAVSFF